MKESSRRAAGLAALVLTFVAGVAGYAAFPAPKPKEPVRIFMTGSGGSVLFSHKDHYSLKSYGPAACEECHHTQNMDPRTAVSCNECHDAGNPAYSRDKFNHKAHAGQYVSACADCHKALYPAGSEPRDCRGCHKADSDAFGPKTMDAFHGQCIRCHEKAGRGPTACDRCHFQEGKRPAVPKAPPGGRSAP